MNIEELLKAIKENSNLADEAIRRCYQHDLKLALWPHRSASPLLCTKATTRRICEKPHFTSDEIQERTRLVEQLLKAHDTLVSYFLSEGVTRKQKRQPLEETFPRDSLDDLHVGLFLLANCGDESAFMELTAKDMSFTQSRFFQESLREWRLNARTDKRAASILKKLSAAIQFPHAPQTGRPPKVTPGIATQYILLKTKDFEKPDSYIYKMIAIESLKKAEKECNQANVKREIERIKKEIQREEREDPRQIAKDIITQQMLLGLDKRRKEHRWNSAFHFLYQTYPEF